MVTRYIVLRNNVFNYKKVEEISEQKSLKNAKSLHFTPVKKILNGGEKKVFLLYSFFRIRQFVRF